jgi:hypothetical protein
MIKKILRVPKLAHEWMHYLPARAFGLNPVILPSWDRIRYDQTTQPRRLIVILFPCLAASAAVILLMWLTWQSLVGNDIPRRLFASAHLLLWVYWLDLCAGDVRKAFSILMKKEEQNENTYS